MSLSGSNSGSEKSKHCRAHLRKAVDPPQTLYNNAGKAVAKVDLYTAGFPCQPYSLAGKRKGPRDERDLSSVISNWVSKCQPRCFVLEQVVGFRSGRYKAGLTCWFSS